MRKTLFLLTSILMFAASCASHYELTSLSRSRILVDSSFDQVPDAEAAAFMAPYKHKVDSIMSPVVGQVATYMWAEKPESNLSNLLADILVWAGKNYGEAPSFSVYNMGGIRAALSEGDVTYGDILAVAPFENKICFFDLSGNDVISLFKQIAHNRGEGVSHGVKLEINRAGELLSASLNGCDIKEDSIYRVSSIDFLAEGNDNLEALKNKTNLNSPQDSCNNMRFVIMDYFKEKQREGVKVDAKVEGRITITDK